MLFTKILIANRGEIARRIIRTCREMGIATVAIHSEADKNGLFVQDADEAINIGGNTSAESYLDMDKLVAAARLSGAEAIHPGYGFLSENADFARRCREEGLVFIGPSPEAIDAMGGKAGAKEIAERHQVPMIPGYQGDDQSPERLEKEAAQIGFPLLIKASAGGGGKGMRIVYSIGELQAAVDAARNEAIAAFGEGRLILEKYFENARHIEVQVLGDQHGNLLHFFERECSMQRRFQKVIEEAPSPTLSPEQRENICADALALARAIGYDNAGTVEMLLDPDGKHYFLEMNTRLQVEHPVTECVTGYDLVRLQIEVAQGLRLSIQQKDIQIRGHAIEARLYAENPRQDFRPVAGTLHLWHQPEVAGLRWESGVASGSEVSTFYDPMIAKVIAHGNSRQEAAARLNRALGGLCALGLTTNRAFLMALVQHPDFIQNQFDTKWIERHLTELQPALSPTPPDIENAALALCLYRWQQRNSTRTLLKGLPSGWRNHFYEGQKETYSYENQEIALTYKTSPDNKLTASFPDGHQAILELAPQENHSSLFTLHSSLSILNSQFSIIIDSFRQAFHLFVSKQNAYIQALGRPELQLEILDRFPDATADATAQGTYTAPMPGQIVRVLVEAGQNVEVGAPLLTLLSMKMENTLYADLSGTVEDVFVETGQFVEAGSVLVKLEITHP